ncbi:BlaI/MecI/CopY family transcriptional regulator, partial [bacterium]|nr:BlaI/MecI/CopY family transcriptional regulator [bacterium]
MSRRQARTLTEVELEFMQVIWRLGEATTDDVLTALAEQGRDLADGSIRKVLSILVQKGYLARRREGRGFVHTPTVEEAEANGSMVRDLLTRAFGGSAALMVASLLDSRDVRK